MADRVRSWCDRKSRAAALWYLIGGCLAIVGTPPARSASPGNRLQVFILAGQSNMEGQAVVDLDGKDYNDGKGTLAQLLRDPVKAPQFRHLRTAAGQWAVRDDVWVRYQRENQPLLRGPLGVGFSVYGDTHHFGPELQLGQVLGDHFTEQVLLIKTAWGGKSLFADFRPPSSGGTVGPYYLKMLSEIRTALANLGTDFPTYQGAGYELAGFVWYHGWNDGVDPQRAVPAYETNLVNLIQDVRRDLGVPKLPVVIGELTGPWVSAPPEWTALRQAQAAVARRPEFSGNVLFVPTHDFVRPAEDSPNPTHGHHEFGNAETYFLVGDALGKGMVELLGGSGVVPDAQRQIEGWIVHIHPDLWRHAAESTEHALRLLQRQLAEIVRQVPAPALAQLRQVPLWFSPEYPGVPPRAEYHPGADWLRANRRDPVMVKGVEFTDVRDFEREMKRMPNFALHELAHGYHDRVLGFDNAEIQAAFERAKASGTYDHVERWFGNGRPNTIEKAYAMTNPQEYFAECTEAFFSRNDFFPFTREELRKADPGMFALLVKLWGDAAREAK